jgi:hypothetical protein
MRVKDKRAKNLYTTSDKKGTERLINTSTLEPLPTTTTLKKKNCSKTWGKNKIWIKHFHRSLTMEGTRNG